MKTGRGIQKSNDKGEDKQKCVKGGGDWESWAIKGGGENNVGGQRGGKSTKGKGGGREIK